jgi:hypothetical protein
MEFGSVVGLVSACTALVAAIAGPVITLTVARRQFGATVISANRQKRIETLRDTLAELIALVRAALVVKSKWKDKWDHGRGPLNADPAMLEKFERIVLAQSKIELLINPIDADHQRLDETIETAIARLRVEESLEAETRHDIRTITALGQTILKREWQRVVDIVLATTRCPFPVVSAPIRGMLLQVVKTHSSCQHLIRFGSNEIAIEL